MDGNQYRNLSNFLKFFINRPNHLAKYLIENDALNQKFLQSLESSPKLKNDDFKEMEVYFIDINQMNLFFKSLVSKNSKKENLEDLKSELNKELEVCIKEERYEDAIRIRDYLKKLLKD